MMGLGAALLAAALAVAPVGGGNGNALTLPAHRHVVRVDPGDGPPIWLLALQQDGIQQRGLSFYRSEDGGRTFHYDQPIHNDWSRRYVADLVQVGNDVALVYSYEAPSLGGSANHDVYFQWWRYQPGSRTFAPEPAIRIFDSPNNTTAYSRAELTIDSTGRIWVQAFRLEAGGASTAVIAVSSDEGATFRHLAPLASVSRRGGGRLLALGDRVIFLWGMHDGFEPAR